MGLTRQCIQYLLEFENNEIVNSYFMTAFPVDELYFQTLVFNSDFANKTSAGGAEPQLAGLVNWRNLHYFEYDKKIKLFSEADYIFLKSRKEFFVRKVDSKISPKLLDLIDADHC